MSVFEFPNNLTDNSWFESEEKTGRLKWCEEFDRVCIAEDQGSMYPLLAQNPINGSPCYSFVFRPKLARPKFLPRTARMLGLDPETHYKKLIEGETVKLENGTVVTP